MASPLANNVKENIKSDVNKASDKISDKLNDKLGDSGLAGNLSDKIHDATDRFSKNVDEYQESAQRIVGEAGEKITEVYRGASDWLQENPGRAVGFAAAFVGVTLLGYFIGRSLKGADRNVEHY